MVLAQDLRDAVLQAAFESKLTDGNDTDTVVPALKPLDEDAPFDISEKWKWTYLREVVWNRKQKKPDTTFSYIDIGSIDNKKHCLNDTENIIEYKNAPSRARKPVAIGDVIYSTVRPYLHNIAIIDKEFSCEPIASTGFATMVCHGFLNNKYLYYYLLSPAFDKYANDSSNSKGVAYPAINDKALYKGPIPIPPIEEQHRIVTRIEELMAKIDEYEKLETELAELKAKFPGEMKAAILQAAMEGAITEQLSEDGNAQDLLTEIETEKEQLIKKKAIQKEKALEHIIETPFDIPNNWQWTRLGSISTYAQSKEKINASKAAPEQWLLDLEDIKKGGQLLRKVIKKKKKAVGDKTVFKKDNILYSKLRPYLLKVLVADEDGICTPELIPFSMYGNISNSFMVYYLKSPYVDAEINRVTYGVKMPRVGTKTMVNLLVPLPPFEEQKRIVEKLDKLLPLCDALEQLA